MTAEKIEDNENETRLTKRFFDNPESIFHDDDKRMMIRTIIDRIKGEVSDKNWAEHMKMVEKLVSSSMVWCLLCSDHGFLVDVENNCWKCTCSSSRKIKNSWPTIPQNRVPR